MKNIQVRVDQATKKFGEVAAVDSLSLDVGEEQFLTILGPSGCGKTTLLRMIGGFEEPTSGRIYIGGQDVTFVPPHKRPSNMVFQRFALFPHLSVFDNVAFGLRIKKMDKKEIHERVDRMLALVQLLDLGKRNINQISGGQAQRVALARALVNEPKVLLLDEPLGALDLKIRQQMQSELKRLHAELGITFIYVTHDQEEAMTVSDRIVVMYEGRIIQEGTPEQIYSNPINAFVADFIGHSNLFPAQVVDFSPLRLSFLTGVYECRNLDGLLRGQEVKVHLRPEAFEIRHVPLQEVKNSVEGAVIDINFKGPYVVYLISVQDTHIQVHYSMREGSRLFSAGERIFLSWAPEDALILVS
jgi:spermidine/putrescine transport system ATP-binding protein